MIASAREEGNPADISTIVRSQLRPRPAAAAPRPEPDPSTLTPEQLKAREAQAAARAKAQEQMLAQLTPKQREQQAGAAAREKQRLEDEKTALKLPLDVLAQMADTACEVSKNSDPVALSAKAEVAFARGDRQTAIALQTKAVEIATGYTKTAEEKRLAEFKAGGS
jgi:hypothetical protein